MSVKLGRLYGIDSNTAYFEIIDVEDEKEKFLSKIKNEEEEPTEKKISIKELYGDDDTEMSDIDFYTVDFSTPLKVELKDALKEDFDNYEETYSIIEKAYEMFCEREKDPTWRVLKEIMKEIKNDMSKYDFFKEPYFEIESKLFFSNLETSLYDKYCIRKTLYKQNNIFGIVEKRYNEC